MNDPCKLLNTNESKYETHYDSHIAQYGHIEKGYVKCVAKGYINHEYVVVDTRIIKVS